MAPSSSRWVALNKTHDQLVRRRKETGSSPASLLGLDLVRDVGRAPASLNAGMQDLLDQRGAARTGKDFTGLDQLRDELAAAGVLVKDTPAGQ